MKQNTFIRNKLSKFLEIKGSDRFNFLQDLITNDINKCKSKDKAIYSCLLTPQGKFIADFFVVNMGNHFLIEIQNKFLNNFINKLKIYKLRSDVEITENLNIVSLIYFNNEIINLDDSIIFKDPRNSNIGEKIFINKASSDLLKINKLKEVSYEFYKDLLIKNLIPNSVYDLIEEKSLLLENNFQNINCIDWKKGCYVGQEITARMKYRSLLKKKIFNLEIVKGDIESGDIITENNINIGKVISKSNMYLICMLKISSVEKKHLSKDIIQINQSTYLKFL